MLNVPIVLGVDSPDGKTLVVALAVVLLDS